MARNQNAVKQDWAYQWAKNYHDRKTGNRVNDILLLARLLRAKVKQREALATIRERKMARQVVTGKVSSSVY